MRTILVIDDEKPTLSMFSLYLEAYGYKVLTADSGEKGLDLFTREAPPIVLTDIKMPGMDGLEVLKAIKEQRPETEVIVITGHGDIDLALKALNLNATDFIDKPIRREALEAALKRAEERMEAQRHREDEIAVRRQEGVTVVSVRGNITSRSEPYLMTAFKEAWGDAGSGKILLAFDKSASINGAGIAVLTQLLLESDRKHGTVVVAGLSENFVKVFEIVGIAGVVDIFETEAEALSHLAQVGA